MERLSKKEIKADQNFDEVLKEHVVKKKRKTLCISIRGSQVVFNGDEDSVKFAKENMDHMTIEELADNMERMDNDDMKFSTTEKVCFPKMFVRFKSRRWTLDRARDQLAIYLNILGISAP